MPPLRSCPVPRRLGAILLFVVGRSLLLNKKGQQGWQGPWLGQQQQQHTYNTALSRLFMLHQSATAGKKLKHLPLFSLTRV